MRGGYVPMIPRVPPATFVCRCLPAGSGGAQCSIAARRSRAGAGAGSVVVRGGEWALFPFLIFFFEKEATAIGARTHVSLACAAQVAWWLHDYCRLIARSIGQPAGRPADTLRIFPGVLRFHSARGIIGREASRPSAASPLALSLSHTHRWQTAGSFHKSLPVSRNFAFVLLLLISF